MQAFIAEAVYTLFQSPKPEYVRDVELEYLRKLSNSFSSLLQVLGSLMVGVSVVEVLGKGASEASEALNEGNIERMCA